MAKNKKHTVDPSDDNFGAVLNCAVRYAMGRQTYMPHLVIDFITPLLPELNDTALWCFDRDIADQIKFGGSFGDIRIDEPKWMQFHAKVKAEIAQRAEKEGQ